MARAWWLVAALPILGCGTRKHQSGGAGGGAGASSTATTASPVASIPKLRPLPELAASIGRKKDPKTGVVTATRLLVAHLTTSDPVNVIVHWEAGDGASISTHAQATRTIHEMDVLQALGARVTSSNDKSAKAVRNLIRPMKPDGETTLGRDPQFVLSLGAEALALRTSEAAAIARPFASPGTYTFTIDGKLTPSEADGMPFESAPIVVEVVAPSPSDRALSEIRAIAAAAVRESLSLPAPPASHRAVIEDVAGHRVVRFVVDAPRAYEQSFVEVVVSRAGEVLSIDTRPIFTCVAVGTLIDTPDGPRPIETLREGSRVWGFDPATRARVVTEVRAAVRSHAARLVEIAPNLRVTAIHPVMTESGALVTAGQLSAGMRLARGDGHVSTVAAIVDAPGADVIELSVDAPHTYIAAGIVVHNKAVATPESLQSSRDTWQSLDFRASGAPQR